MLKALRYEIKNSTTIVPAGVAGITGIAGMVATAMSVIQRRTAHAAPPHQESPVRREQG